MSHNVTSSASSGPRLNEWSKSGMTAAARLTQLQQQQQPQQQQQQGASHGVQESTIVSPPPKGNKNRSRRGSHLSSKPGAATPSMNAVPRSPNPEPCSGSQQDPAQQGASVGAVEPVTPPVAQPSLPTSNGGDTLLKQGHITPPLTQSGFQAGNSSPASPVPMSSSGTAFRFNASITNKMLDMSYRNLSHPLDCEKAKPYLPPNPYRTMSFYPQEPHPVLSTPDLFHKLDADTLFFIFYYQQATYQQYLAALELKRQSWRYHKKYLTWFQRQEKPLQVTEDFEEGKYIYFDYESGWSARSKQDFTFKYTYLEDELV